MNSTTGAISGTPTTAGAYSITVEATNSVGSDTQVFSGTVEAPSAATSVSSVYRYGVPADLTSHTDAGDGNWLGHGFYFISGLSLTGVKITGIRVYVQAGSPLIGFTGGRVSLSRSTTVQSPLGNSDFESGAVLSLPALTAGWNEVSFGSPYDAQQYMGVAYELNGNYLYGGSKMGVPAKGVATSDGVIYRNFNDSDGQFSSTYMGGSSVAFCYGIEPVVQFPSAYPPVRPDANYIRKTPFHSVGGPSTAHPINYQPAAAGSKLLLVLYGAVTVATPSGWTLEGSGVGDGAAYVFSKTATAGESSVSVTAGATNYSLIGSVYEYPAGTTVATAASSNSLGAAANQPSLTVPSTGTYDIFQVRGMAEQSGLVGTIFGFTSSGGFTDMNVASVADYLPSTGGAQVTVGIHQDQSLTAAGTVASSATAYSNGGTPVNQQAVSLLLVVP